MKFECKYALGQFVYTRTGPDRESPWIVVSVGFRLGGSIVYGCSQGSANADFFEAELRAEPCYGLGSGLP